jgi:hypothetical protein
MAAIRDVFSAPDAKDGYEREEALILVSRALGYERLGPKIREVLDGAIRSASRRQIIGTEGTRYRLFHRSIGEYPRELLIKLLLADAKGWWEREELVSETNRYLGFRRLGDRAREAFASAINGAIRRGLLERDGSRVRKI